LRVFCEHANYGTDPFWVDHHIVICEGDNLASGFDDGPIAGPIETGSRLEYVADARVAPLHQCFGFIVLRSIVNNKEVQIRIRELGKAPKTQLYIVWTVPCADGNRHQRLGTVVDWRRCGQ
jgi:hypothetical protein